VVAPFAVTAGRVKVLHLRFGPKTRGRINRLGHLAVRVNVYSHDAGGARGRHASTVFRFNRR
jgi:hypothetical protein